MLNLDKTRWETVRFGDVVRNVTETVRDVSKSEIELVIALEHLDPGEVTISRYGSVADGTTFTRRVRPGQTLFGKRRAYQRKAAHAEVDAICSGDILVFEPLDGRLSARLLPFLVHSDAYFDHALGTSAGSLSPRTNWRSLANFEFALPPLDEQERIADLLWAVEHHRQAVVAAETAGDDVSRSYLDELLTEYGQETLLADVTLAVVDCPHSTAPTDESDYARVIGTPEVRHGLINVDSARPVSKETYEKWTARATPQPGDLILTREAPAGEVGIVPPGARVCLGQRTVLIKPNSTSDGQMLWAALQSEAVQRRIRLKSAGSTVPHLNMGEIRNMPIQWVRAPERREVVLAGVERLRGLTTSLEAEFDSLTTLRDSLLVAFFGDAS